MVCYANCSCSNLCCTSPHSGVARFVTVRISEFVKSKYKAKKSWETGYSESSGSTYAKTQKSRPRSSSQHPTTRQRCNHQTSARLTESCHLRSKCVLKFGTQRADTQPNIDGRGGVNPNLQVPSVQELSRMLEQQELLWGKAVKVSTSIVTKVSQFSSRAV